MKNNKSTNQNVSGFVAICRQKNTGCGAPKFIERAATPEEAGKKASEYFGAKYGGEWEPVMWANAMKHPVWKSF